MTEQAIRRAQEAFAIEADALREAGQIMDMQEFGRAVQALKSAPRIAASGCGHSGIACRHFAHLMCCIERPARFISPAEAVHGATGYVQAGDVLTFYLVGEAITLPADGAYTKSGAEQDVPVASAVYVTKNK